MSESVNPTALAVADARRRFSELIDRVEGGEEVLLSRRGKVVAARVPVDAPRPTRSPVGLAAVAGALADWDGLPEFVEEMHAARRTEDMRIEASDDGAPCSG